MLIGIKTVPIGPLMTMVIYPVLAVNRATTSTLPISASGILDFFRFIDILNGIGEETKELSRLSRIKD